MAPLDAFDLAILRVLQRDNTTPLRIIGEAVNLSAPSVQRRIRRMEAEGVITERIHLQRSFGMPKPQTTLNDAGASVAPRPPPQREGAVSRQILDKQLDAELEQTFPASDALTITRDRH